jgi:hypothetical protein
MDGESKEAPAEGAGACEHDYWMSTAEPVDETADETRLEVTMICDLCGDRTTVTPERTFR